MDYNNYYFLVNYGLPILGVLITAIAQIFINISYSKYRRVPITKKMTGLETARTILDANGLKDVKVNLVSGNLTDHYDPRNKTVNLSRDIYEGYSIASVSVAAHECGHAIQDKENYAFLRIRASLVPLVNFSSKFGYIVVLIGLLFNIIGLAKFGIILLLAILLFQLVTLPVEFNASRRAGKQLSSLNILETYEESASKTMLISAAFTYVASLASTLLQILRLALIVIGRDDD